jgi:hypothetical protein
VNTVYDVLRALVDAVLRGGSVTEAQHAAMHEVIAAADPAVAEAKKQAEQQLSDAEAAELARLLEKRQAAETAAAAAAAAEAPAAAVAAPGAGFNQAPAG